MTLEAKKAQVLTLEEKLERLKSLENKALQEENEKFQGESEELVELIALENYPAYEELERNYDALYKQYEGTTMTLEAERAQVLTLEEKLKSWKG